MIYYHIVYLAEVSVSCQDFVCHAMQSYFSQTPDVAPTDEGGVARRVAMRSHSRCLRKKLSLTLHCPKKLFISLIYIF